jgi:hypothetical protein
MIGPTTQSIGSVGTAGILLFLAACNGAHESASPDLVTAPTVEKRFPTTIHLPVTRGQARAESTVDGERLPTLVCSSCHASREVKLARTRIEDVKTVHNKLEVAHGSLSCAACHDADSAYDSFRLADGEIIEYDDVMELCSQCHGPQRTDYDHGAHGGMTGYWDLSRGPRDRNACPVCHDPHSPAFPKMRPTFKPICEPRSMRFSRMSSSTG